ncbi:MAG: hypothetical protein WC636_04205, partial [Candidatus Margulisiibacteriota bacterium]
ALLHLEVKYTAIPAVLLFDSAVWGLRTIKIKGLALFGKNLLSGLTGRMAESAFTIYSAFTRARQLNIGATGEAQISEEAIARGLAVDTLQHSAPWLDEALGGQDDAINALFDWSRDTTHSSLDLVPRLCGEELLMVNRVLDAKPRARELFYLKLGTFSRMGRVVFGSAVSDAASLSVVNAPTSAVAPRPHGPRTSETTLSAALVKAWLSKTSKTDQPIECVRGVMACVHLGDIGGRGVLGWAEASLRDFREQIEAQLKQLDEKAKEEVEIDTGATRIKVRVYAPDELSCLPIVRAVEGQSLAAVLLAPPLSVTFQQIVEALQEVRTKVPDLEYPFIDNIIARVGAWHAAGGIICLEKYARQPAGETPDYRDLLCRFLKDMAEIENAFREAKMYLPKVPRPMKFEAADKDAVVALLEKLASTVPSGMTRAEWTLFLDEATTKVNTAAEEAGPGGAQAPAGAAPGAATPGAKPMVRGKH